MGGDGGSPQKSGRVGCGSGVWVLSASPGRESECERPGLDSSGPPPTFPGPRSRGRRGRQVTRPERAGAGSRPAPRGAAGWSQQRPLRQPGRRCRPQHTVSRPSRAASAVGRCVRALRRSACVWPSAPLLCGHDSAATPAAAPRPEPHCRLRCRPPSRAWTPGRTVRGHGRCAGAGPGFRRDRLNPPSLASGGAAEPPGRIGRGH